MTGVGSRCYPGASPIMRNARSPTSTKSAKSPENLVFIDFWGRVTVYSLWFMCYEVYRKYLQEDAPQAAPSANRGFVARVRTT